MEWLKGLRAEQLAMLVAIVAIIMGAISSIVKRVIRHRERMAMIEQGMHPDEKRESKIARE